MKAPLVVIANWRDRDHPQAGGAETVCENLAAHLVERGCRVAYVTSAVEGRPAVETRDGYRIHRRGGRFTVYPWTLLWLARHRRSIAAVIDSQNGIPFFTPLAVGPRTPVILLMHHVHRKQLAAEFRAPLATFGQFLEGPATRLAYGRRAIVAVSPSTRQEIRQTLGLTGTITVAPPGADAPFNPVCCRAASPRIVCVGRLTPHKRMHLVIETVKTLLPRYPDLELHIVGDGPARSVLEASVRELGLTGKVVFHGMVANHERDQLRASAWLSVYASEAEGWCISVIEANAFGVPVVAVRRPGLRDSIREGETGWLVDDEAGLPEAVARALDELSDSDRATEWSRRTREWAAAFTWEEMAERLWQAIVAERGRLANASGERRRPTDTVTLVEVPNHLVPSTWEPTLRSSDRMVSRSDSQVLVLQGTDTALARVALIRSGLPRRIVDDPRVSYRVARPIDLVLPGGSATLTDRATLTGWVAPSGRSAVTPLIILEDSLGASAT